MRTADSILRVLSLGACVLMTTLALARWTSLPVTPPDFTPQHALWTALILAGVVGLSVTEAARG